jgi:hypothetical protein
MLVAERKGENLASLGSASSLDFEWADRSAPPVGPENPHTVAELLIDREEDRTLRAVLVGMLRGPSAGARDIESSRLVKRRTSSCSTCPSAPLGVDHDSSSLPITGQSSG